VAAGEDIKKPLQIHILAADSDLLWDVQAVKFDGLGGYLEHGGAAALSITSLIFFSGASSFVLGFMHNIFAKDSIADPGIIYTHSITSFCSHLMTCPSFPYSA